MEEWQNSAGWTREGICFVHRGGNLVLYPGSAAGGFVFTAVLRKGKRLQWVVNVTDDKNYALFQIDKKYFYRNQVINGKSKGLAKVRYDLGKENTFTMRVIVTAGAVRNQIRQRRQLGRARFLDRAGPGFCKGKFGFLISGRDELAVSNFSLSPL